MSANVALYPWLKALQGVIFWQAVWFLFFQSRLSAAEAVLLYAVYDVATTALEVPSGWMSDRWGRRPTLIAAGVAGFGAAVLMATGDGFAVFVLAQVLLGAQAAFVSGTDSAILYESLSQQGRAAEVERHELRGWRALFSALAISALAGGLLYRVAPTAPYWASAAAFAAMAAVAWRMSEPARHADLPQGAEFVRLANLRGALTHPVLIWLFALSVLMYGFSHVTFVFGQPFILRALDGTWLAGETPVVSGAVTAAMMLTSVAVSMVAPGLRRRIGLGPLLLLAFAVQVALPAALILAVGPLAVVLLLSRMVPDALARPFVLARIQPLLSDDSRATYLSLQSLVGRIAFAATLWLAARATTDVGLMSEAELRLILGTYAAGGLACLAILAITATRLAIDPPRR